MHGVDLILKKKKTIFHELTFVLALNPCVLVFSWNISILCVLETDLAEVHLPQDTCALSPGAQGPAAIFEWRLGGWCGMDGPDWPEGRLEPRSRVELCIMNPPEWPRGC